MIIPREILAQLKKVAENCDYEDSVTVTSDEFTHCEVMTALLQDAADKDDWSLAIWAINNDADVMVNGYEVLELAMHRGATDAVRAFVEHGADVNAVPVLQCAAQQGDVELVTFLLKRGAECAGIYDNAYFAAADCGHKDVMRLIEAHCPSRIVNKTKTGTSLKLGL